MTSHGGRNGEAVLQYPVSLAVEEWDELRYHMVPELRLCANRGRDEGRVCVVGHGFVRRPQGYAIISPDPNRNRTHRDTKIRSRNNANAKLNYVTNNGAPIKRTNERRLVVKASLHRSPKTKHLLDKLRRTRFEHAFLFFKIDMAPYLDTVLVRLATFESRAYLPGPLP
jgi:hypothetical protein